MTSRAWEGGGKWFHDVFTEALTKRGGGSQNLQKLCDSIYERSLETERPSNCSVWAAQIRSFQRRSMSICKVFHGIILFLNNPERNKNPAGGFKLNQVTRKKLCGIIWNPNLPLLSHVATVGFRNCFQLDFFLLKMCLKGVDQLQLKQEGLWAVSNLLYSICHTYCQSSWVLQINPRVGLSSGCFVS